MLRRGRAVELGHEEEEGGAEAVNSLSTGVIDGGKLTMESPHILAAAADDLEPLRAYLKRYPTRREDAMGQAVSAGYENAVGELLSAGVNVDFKNVQGNTPLYRGAASGHARVVRVLLEKGADKD